MTSPVVYSLSGKYGSIYIQTTFFRGMRNFEPSCGICPFPQNFCFHGILRNLVLASDVGDKYGLLWWSSGHHTVCIHDFTMKYMTATRALMEGIVKILS